LELRGGARLGKAERRGLFAGLHKMKRKVCDDEDEYSIVREKPLSLRAGRGRRVGEAKEMEMEMIAVEAGKRRVAVTVETRVAKMVVRNQEREGVSDDLRPGRREILPSD
jgi:hypothetical protein